jgi:CHASE1-domain containing sensor protein
MPGFVAACVGLTLSVGAWFGVSLREDRLAQQELSARANSHALILQNGINEYIYKIAALRALFESSGGEVKRQEFANFSEFLLREQNAILAVSWIPRITRAQRAAHELAAVRDGFRTTTSSPWLRTVAWPLPQT